MQKVQTCRQSDFNPRSPHGERQPRSLLSVLWHISIHAPRTGSDVDLSVLKLERLNFNPRSPHGERRTLSRVCRMTAYISIHAPRTGSDVKARAKRLSEDISIHAPRTGSDTFPTSPARHSKHFNPRSPHGERRGLAAVTRPQMWNFNPRSPHGERPSGQPEHASGQQFQSTLPARGATCTGVRKKLSAKISIHAPRTGSDFLLCAVHAPYSNFNPRSPHGERLSRLAFLSDMLTISIHAPRTGSDDCKSYWYCAEGISIHAPRTGSDEILKAFYLSKCRFQSTLPARGATRPKP